MLILLVLASTSNIAQSDYPEMPNTGNAEQDLQQYEQAKMAWYQENFPELLEHQNDPQGLPPSNDLCGYAVKICCGDIILGNNIEATSDVEDCVGTSSQLTVWYKYTASGSMVTVSTCNSGSEFDTYLSVFKGSCGELMCVGQNDDHFGCSFDILRSTVSFVSEPETEYLIAVSGFGSNNGSFELSIFEEGCTPPVACEDEANPIPTLSQWSLIILVLCLSLIGLMVVRVRRLTIT